MEKSNYPSIVVGDIVGLTLKDPVAHIPCYVGLVFRIDSYGILLWAVNWETGKFGDISFFFPWGNITGANVVSFDDNDNTTPEVWFKEHGNNIFGQFQTRCLMTNKQVREMENEAKNAAAKNAAAKNKLVLV
jgi:hypothetical protein